MQPSPEHAAIEKKIKDEREYFSRILSPNDYRRFQDLEDLYGHSSGFDSIDAFSYGLCMGALQMMEVFIFKEKRLTETE